MNRIWILSVLLCILLSGCGIDSAYRKNDYLPENSLSQKSNPPFAEYYAEQGFHIFSINIIPNSNNFWLCLRKTKTDGESSFYFYIIDAEFKHKSFLFSSEYTDTTVFCDGNDGLYFINNNIAMYFQEERLIWEKNLSIPNRVLCNNDKGYIWQDDCMNLRYTTWDQITEEILWPATYQKNTTKFPDTDDNGNFVATWSDKIVFNDDGKRVLLKEYQGGYNFKIAIYDLENHQSFKSENIFYYGKIFFCADMAWLFEYGTNSDVVSQSNPYVSSINLTEIKEYESPIIYKDAYPGKNAILLLGEDNGLYYLDSNLKKYERISYFDENSILLNAVSNDKFTLVHLCTQPGKWVVQTFENPW